MLIAQDYSIRHYQQMQINLDVDAHNKGCSDLTNCLMRYSLVVTKAANRRQEEA